MMTVPGAVSGHTRRGTRFSHANGPVIAARRLLEDFAASHGNLVAPVPVFSIARWLGYQVVLLSTVGDEFSGLVSTRQKLIGINAYHHRHRQRFSVAHEIGHILMRHPAESHCSIREIARWNAEADLFAGELLVPENLLAPFRSPGRGVDALAERFDISRDAMRIRLAGVD